MKRQIGYHILLLTAVLLLGAAFYLLQYRWDNKYTAALPGGYGYNVLQEDPDQVVFLVDGWEYYPGQLLSPEDFEGGVSPQAYTYIGQYSNFSDSLGSPYGTATYRLVLENRGQAVSVALYLPELLCAGRVYIDGVLVGEQGSVAPYQPRVVDSVYAFTASGKTEIVIQCANYSHYYSGMYYPPAVGTLDAISRMVVTRLLVYGLLCFAALAVALSNLTQWLLGRDKLSRWMGWSSLSFSLWVCYPFLRALGVPLVRPLYALEDACANAVLLCAILLAGEVAGTAARWYHRRLAIPAAAGLCAVTVVFPLCILPYVPQFINAYGLLLFFWKSITGVYLVFLAGHTLRTSRPLGRYLLCASGLYGLSIVVSVLGANRFEPICGAWPEEYGGFALVAGFAAMMVRRFGIMARENRHLTRHLQEEVSRKTLWMETLLTERRELLANLLHDLKNPLAALRSYAELVRSGGVALDQETAGYLDALTERAGVVEERFELIQGFSREERRPFQWEEICLNNFLRQFYLSNCPDIELFGPDFHLELPKSTLTVRGDRGRLQSALENLCYNALSFTPEDGVITLGLVQEGQYAVLSVRDTGQGISPEDLPHVFERGFTRRPDGTGDGLGLYIVRTIALEHRGYVDVASQPGKGAVFSVRLPLLPEKDA